VFAPERVFKDDPLAVDVRVEGPGFDGETVQVELFAEFLAGGEAAGAAAGAQQRVGVTSVAFEAGREATARFEVRLERPGRHRLRARVAERPEETFTDDNEALTVVEVVEQATRVLYIAGAPSSEYRILKNLLRRDRRIELSAWLMSADPEYPQEGNQVLTRLPATPEDLFAYDVVILHDPDPRALPPGFADLLERFVGAHRGGLAYIAGEKYTTPLLRAPAMGSLCDRLPVVPDLVTAESEYGRGRYHQKSWPLVPTAAASAHAATRLSSSPERNRELWAELAGVYWTFPVRRAKPGSTVLLRHSDPALSTRGEGRPLVTFQFYEGGRVLFSAFDETWRWRALSEELYDRFWMQSLRTLTEGRLLGDRRRLLLSDRDEYDLGDVVRVSAFVQDKEYRPSEAESFEVEALDPAGERSSLVLARDPEQAGWFRGVLLPERVGVYEIRGGEQATKAVQVHLPNVEYAEPRLDVPALRGLAERTGGSAVFPESLEAYAEIPAKIADRRRTLVFTDEPRPLWDNLVCLLAVVGLLTIEWVGRKLSRLP
jgi:hypothetical protein